MAGWIDNFIALVVTGVMIAVIKVLLTVEHHSRRKAWPKEWR